MSQKSLNPQMKNPNCVNSQGLDSINHQAIEDQPMSMVAQLPENENLIPVLDGEIGGVAQPVVNARELYKFLESKQDFSTWIKRRIKEYDFAENVEFFRFHRKVEANNAVMTDYHLSLDMAKELSMVERNAKGKAARRYFLRCEKALYEANNNLMMQFNRALLEFEKYSDLASQAGRTLAIVGKQIKPQARDRADSLKKRLQPLLPLDFGGVA